MAGIYLHVPFCKQACYYCDFHFSTQTDYRKKMIRSMARELDIQKEYLGGEPVKTIYFGGGTPSILEADEINLLLTTIHKIYDLDAEPEVTLEANPDDLSLVKLRELKQLGVNRLSIGIQSFEDDVLKFLHRAHSADAATRAYEEARIAGFENISIDLIYAIPNQDDVMWKKNIDKALALMPEHLSSYSLTIEDKTVFGKWKQQNKLTEVDETTAARQLEILIDKLVSAGMEHYEVSNFAQPGFYSRHNSSYWKQVAYLGIGPGAHSYNLESRQSNISNNPIYIKSMEAGTVPFERELLSRENKINEYIFTTLRTHWGCDLNHLKQNLDYDLRASLNNKLSFYLSSGHLNLESSVIRLTKKGMLIADRISSDLFVDS